jgi:uncharacterized membrane protein
MEERPKIRLELTSIDKVIEITGRFSLLVIWVFTIVNYTNLPDTIPTHFNAMGEADGFGGKASVLTLPIIATILFVGIALLNKYPHIFNYPTKITKENAQRQYTIATRWIRYLNLVTVLIIGYIAFTTIQGAKGEADGLGVWFLPLSLGIVFIPTIYVIVKLIKK